MTTRTASWMVRMVGVWNNRLELRKIPWPYISVETKVALRQPPYSSIREYGRVAAQVKGSNT